MDFTLIAVYYFFTRCEEHSDIDSVFQPTMDDRLKKFTYSSERRFR